MGQLPVERVAGRPLNIAHRGASAAAPGNTLAAFQRAVELNSDGVEFDVQLSTYLFKNLPITQIEESEEGGAGGEPGPSSSGSLGIGSLK